MLKMRAYLLQVAGNIDSKIYRDTAEKYIPQHTFQMHVLRCY
jgi:hypothetical protein